MTAPASTVRLSPLEVVLAGAMVYPAIARRLVTEYDRSDFETPGSSVFEVIKVQLDHGLDPTLAKVTATLTDNGFQEIAEYATHLSEALSELGLTEQEVDEWIGLLKGGTREPERSNPREPANEPDDADPADPESVEEPTPPTDGTDDEPASPTLTDRIPPLDPDADEEEQRAWVNQFRTNFRDEGRSVREEVHSLALPMLKATNSKNPGVRLRNVLLWDAAVVSAEPAEWPKPKELPPEWPAAPRLPANLLPGPLRPWCEDIAARMQIPLEMVAVPALVALAAVVGRNVRMQPKRRDTRWVVTPNLWGAVVSPPGRMKSPTLTEALGPLKTLQAEAREAFDREKHVRAAHKDALDARAGAIKNCIRRFHEKGTGEPVKFEGCSMNARELEERLAELKKELDGLPTETRFITNDPTVEKIVELLRENPRGLLLVRDELAGWMRSLDKAERRGDREFWMESWDGNNSWTSDRIGRGTTHASGLCISIVGGIPPGKFKNYVRDALAGGDRADGFLQRLQLSVWPDPRAGWTLVDRGPDWRAEQAVQATFRRLSELPPEDAPRRFAPDAQELFDAWWSELESRIRSKELEHAEGFLAHLAKFRSLMPSLALLFHLLADVPTPEVSLEAAKRAAGLCEFLEAHARKIYAPELNAGITAARALGERFLEGDLEDRVTVRDIYRRGWSGLQTADQARAALQVLEDHHWTRVERVGEGTNGRPSEVVRINPRLLARSSGGSVSRLPERPEKSR